MNQKKSMKLMPLIGVVSILVVFMNTAIEAAPLFVISPSSIQNQTQSISIPLTLNNDTSIAIESIDLEIGYNADILMAFGVSLTGTILENDNYLFNYNTNEPGYIYIAFAASENLYTGTGLLLNLEFTVTGTAGETSGITFSKAWLNDTIYTTTDGLFTVAPNSAPDMENISPQIFDEDTSHSIVMTFSDSESNPCDLTISVESSDDSILPNENISISGTCAQRTLTLTPTSNRSGVVTLTVTISDGLLTSYKTIDLTITNVNDSPIAATSLLNQSISEDVFYTFTVDVNTFTDPDNGDILSYTAIQTDGNSLPSWLTFDPSTRTFSGLPENSDVGMISITVVATDTYFETASNSFQMTIINSNDTPVVAQTISNQTATEDQAFNFVVDSQTFFDEDTIFGDVLTYTATLDSDQMLPSWLTFDPSTRQLSGTPENADVGVITIKVTAIDSYVQFTSTTFNLTINNVNDAPDLIFPISDQYATEDTLFDFTISNGTFDDDDLIHGDTLTYSATLENGSALPDWLTFNPSTQQFSGIPLNEDVGILSIEMKVSDNSNILITDIFKITIQNVNDTPQISPVSNQAINEDSATSNISFTISDDETSSDLLIVSGTSSNQSLIPDTNIVFSGINGNRLIQLTPLANMFGSSDITIYVSDSAYTSTTTFTLTVNSVNDIPTLENAISDQNIQEDIAFNFTVAINTFSDIDLSTGDNLTYSATLTNNQPLPSWLHFNSSTRTFSGTPLNDDVGQISISVTAKDTQQATVTDDFDITISNANDSPVLAISINDQYARQDDSFHYAINTNTFTDDDIIHGDILNYSAKLSNGDPLPSWLTFNATNKEFSGTPTNDDVTNLSIEVIATDSENATASDIFVLYIQDINYAPTIETISDQTTNELTNSTPLNFNVSDVDSTNISVDAVSSDQLLIPDDHINLTNVGDTYTISITPIIGQVGSTTITVSASDGLSSTTQTFQITVQEAYLSVSGHVAYYMTTENIENVVMTLSGTRSYSTLTDSNGDYVFSNVRPGDYTLSATKTEDIGKLTLSDAIQILKSVARIVSLNCDETIAADVTQNGTNSAMDASKVARYVAGIESCLNDNCLLWSFMTLSIDTCNTWPPITYQQELELNSLTNDVSGQNFIGIFLGDIIE